MNESEDSKEVWTINGRQQTDGNPALEQNNLIVVGAAQRPERVVHSVIRIASRRTGAEVRFGFPDPDSCSLERAPQGN